MLVEGFVSVAPCLERVPSLSFPHCVELVLRVQVNCSVVLKLGDSAVNGSKGSRT